MQTEADDEDDLDLGIVDEPHGHGTDVLVITADNVADGLRRLEHAINAATFVALSVASSTDGPAGADDDDDLAGRFSAAVQGLPRAAVLELGVAAFRRRPPRNPAGGAGSAGSPSSPSPSSSSASSSSDDELHNSDAHARARTEASPDVATAYFSVRVFKLLFYRADDAPVLVARPRFLAARGVALNQAFRSGISYSVPSTTASAVSEPSPGRSGRSMAAYAMMHSAGGAAATPPLVAPRQHSNGWGRSFPAPLATGYGAHVVQLLAESTVPVAFHDGLPHLVSLFHPFHTPLRPDAGLGEFLTRLGAVLPRLIDTRYIAEAQFSESKATLSQLYAKHRRRPVTASAPPPPPVYGPSLGTSTSAPQNDALALSTVNPTAAFPSNTARLAAPPNIVPAGPATPDDDDVGHLLQRRIEGLLEDSFDSPANSNHSGKVFEPLYRRSLSSDLSRSLRERMHKFFERRGLTDTQEEPVRRDEGEEGDSRQFRVVNRSRDDEDFFSIAEWEGSVGSGTAREAFMVAAVFATYAERIGWARASEAFEGHLWGCRRHPDLKVSAYVNRGMDVRMEPMPGTQAQDHNALLGGPEPNRLRMEYLRHLGMMSRLGEPLNWNRMTAAASDRVDRLIDILSPSPFAERTRATIFDEVDSLVKRVLGGRSFLYGSTATKTYLAHSPVQVGAFLVQQDEEPHSWLTRLMSTLCENACERAFGTSVGGGLDKESNIHSISCTPAGDLGAILTFESWGVHVQVSLNDVAGMNFTCFLEELDRVVGSDHLLKKSIILIAGWAAYGGRVGGEGREGGIPAQAIVTMVLYVFNAFHAQVKSPLNALHKFLQFYTQIDWATHGISIFGPVRLRDGFVIARATENMLFESILMSHYSLNTEPARRECPGTQPEPRADVVDRQLLTVFDPLDGSRNLCNRISNNELHSISTAFVNGLKGVEMLESAPSVANLTGVFGTCVAAHLALWRRSDEDLSKMMERALGAGLSQEPVHSPTLAVPRVRPSTLRSLGLCSHSDPLHADLAELKNNLEYVRFIVHSCVSEQGLLAFLTQILTEHRGLLIGEIGQHLRSTFGRQDWSSILRERFGGLKRFLVKHSDLFFVDSDHALNPHVYLRANMTEGHSHGIRQGAAQRGAKAVGDAKDACNGGSIKREKGRRGRGKGGSPASGPASEAHPTRPLNL